MHNPIFRLAPAVALSLPLLAGAQQSPPPSAKASAPTLPYRSAFADYKPWQDIKPGNWRQLNDTLTSGAAGGHAGHGATPAAKPAPAASAPAPRHHGHHNHGATP
jgi:hypothetical protein